MQIITCSSKETRELGQKTGALIKAPAVLALTGDLGSGKTSFVQGLAKGLAVPADYYITSPTYTIINEYPGRCRLFHVDLYRTKDPADFEEIGLFDILYSDGVVAVEWADRLGKDFLSEYTAIHFVILNNKSRSILMTSYGSESTDLLIKIDKLSGG